MIGGGGVRERVYVAQLLKVARRDCDLTLPVSTGSGRKSRVASAAKGPSVHACSVHVSGPWYPRSQEMRNHRPQ